MGRRLCFCVIVVATGSIVSPAQLFQMPKAVRLTVSADKRTYKIGEKIVASYRLQNVGSERLFVPVRFSADCPPRERLITELQDESGKAMAGGYVGDCSPRSFSSRLEKIKADSKLLFPGEQYAPEETFQTQGLKPGLYRVTARVNAWKAAEFSNADRQELRQFGVPILTGTLSASVRMRLIQ
jgi:hypothetical protein